MVGFFRKATLYIEDLKQFEHLRCWLNLAYILQSLWLSAYKCRVVEFLRKPTISIEDFREFEHLHFWLFLLLFLLYIFI